MSNYICTIYAHEGSFDLVSNEAKKLFPASEWTYERRNEFTEATIVIKGGFLRPKKKLKISYRERAEFSFELKNAVCPVTSNLIGMRKMVENIQTSNRQVQTSLLKLIETINIEFSIVMLENSEKEFKALVQHLAHKLDAFVFAQPRTGLMNSISQAFLDKDLALILDVDGQTGVEDVKIPISKKFLENDEEVADIQLNRKAASERDLRQLGLRINPDLPSIQTEESTRIKSAQQIAERITALALTNLVAYNNIGGDQAIQYATKNEIIDFLTPKEIEFLKNPSDEAKHHETWKCESIWTLFWALEVIPTLVAPNQLADLTRIPEHLYPIGSSVNPYEFIAQQKKVRSTSEILDANDLYYRMHWACKEAKLKDEPLLKVHPGVVYERHYALNWLIGYKNQDWDHVSTNT